MKGASQEGAENLYYDLKIWLYPIKLGYKGEWQFNCQIQRVVVKSQRGVSWQIRVQQRLKREAPTQRKPLRVNPESSHVQAGKLLVTTQHASTGLEYYSTVSPTNYTFNALLQCFCCSAQLHRTTFALPNSELGDLQIHGIRFPSGRRWWGRERAVLVGISLFRSIQKVICACRGPELLHTCARYGGSCVGAVASPAGVSVGGGGGKAE